MKNIIQYLQSRLSKVFAAKTTDDFYYPSERLQYHQHIENNRLRYLTSLDKAA